METTLEFKGRCKGVQLVNRGVNDNHICVRILTEDDGNWFVDGKNQFSSYWIDDLIKQLQLAKKHLENVEEPDIHDGIQYGYKFKQAQ